MHHSRICLAILAVAACTAAEGGPPPKAGGPPPGQRPPGPPPEELFRIADADKDGKVTLAEFTAALEARRQDNRQDNREENRTRIFEAMDTNKDGMVSKEEFLAFEPPKPRPGQGREEQGPGQGQGQGQEPRREPPLPEMLFKRLDLNGDGTLTLEEVQAAKEHAKDRREGGGGEDKPHDGPPGQH